MSKDSNRYMSRRKAIKVAAGATAFSSVGTATAGRVERQVNIPVVISGDEIVKSKKVSKKWKQQEEKADKVLSNIHNSHSKDQGVAAIAKGIDDDKKEEDGMLVM